jgi:hypothetical protein
MSGAQQQYLFGDEHVRRYRETDGKEGHIWREGRRSSFSRRPAATPATSAFRSVRTSSVRAPARPSATSASGCGSG